MRRLCGSACRIIVVASLAIACAESRRSAPERATRGISSAQGEAPVRYLALGDSFTIGTGSPPARAFPTRLADRWRAQGCALEVQNVAVNGYTTDDVIAEELPAFAVFRPTLVTVAIGANDIVRGRTIEAYRVMGLFTP